MDGTAEVRLCGVDDTTVLGYARDFKGQGRNHNFPAYVGDENTRLAASSDREFWWKYFQIMRSLGMNCVRLNGGGQWCHEQLINWLEDDEGGLRRYLLDMLDMAEASGCYVVLCILGSEYDVTLSTKLTDSVLVPDSPEYARQTAFAKWLMRTCAGHPGLGLWEGMNEPDSNAYAAWWKAKYPTDYRAKFKAWQERLVVDLITFDHSHPIGMGLALQGSPLCNWSSSQWAACTPSNADFWSAHRYGTVKEDDTQLYWVKDPVAWAKASGRPMLYGEVGKNDVAPEHYWAWVDSVARANGISLCWMSLGTMPGYPVAQALIDALPPMPPAPGAPVVQHVRVKVPVFELQLPQIVIPAQQVVRTLVVNGMDIDLTATLPERTVPAGKVLVDIPEFDVEVR
jgi:hypothetical protein